MIDPWLNANRDAISSSLVNITRVPALFGDDNLGNILWGLTIQTRWQISSGRYQSTPSPRIDEFSWWSAINYFLTTVPYLLAVKCKLLPTTQFLPPQVNSPDKFPTIYEDIDPQIAAQWTDYFETIKILQTDPTHTSLENLQRILWKVHDHTVVGATSIFKHELKLLNSRERSFSNGFANFVEVLAIMNLNTSYPALYTLNKMFPQRVLRLLDVPPLIFDMSIQQNALISTMFVINDLTVNSPSVWASFVKTLRNGVADVNCAAKLTQTFNKFFNAPNGNLIATLTSIYTSSCL